MTIERGADWGEVDDKPDDLLYFHSDRAAATAIAAARRANRRPPPIGMTGGDLHRTLGGGGGSKLVEATTATHVKVDIGAALLDGKLHWFLAHLVVRRSWLRGRIIVVSNAAFLGPWNIAPRAHPADGRLDVLDGSPDFGDRLKARRRLPSGTHLPHPDISVRRAAAVQYQLSRALPVYLDGQRVTVARTLSIRIEPDAVDVWI